MIPSFSSCFFSASVGSGPVRNLIPHPGQPSFFVAPTLHVQELDLERMLLDELAARFDLFTHQHRKHPVGLETILDGHVQQRPPLRIHRRG